MTRDELQQELHTSLIVWFDAPDPKLKKMADFLAMRLHPKLSTPKLTTGEALPNHARTMKLDTRTGEYDFDQEYGVK